MSGTAPWADFSWTVRLRDSAGQIATQSIFCDGSVYLTSRLYPVEVIESVNAGGGLLAGDLRDTLAPVVFQPESVDMVGALTGGVLRVLLINYTHYQPESVDVVGLLTGADLRVVLVQYTHYQPESVDMVGSLTGGVLRTLLINYTHYQPESVDVSGSLTGGSLT